MDSDNKPTYRPVKTNPEWIPGIYQYCDRWCERCDFTSRCKSFALEFGQPQEEAHMSAQEKKRHDRSSRQFSNELEEAFWTERDRYQEKEKDWNEALNDQEWDRQHPHNKALEQEVSAHPVATAAWKYSALAERWLKINEELLSGKMIQLETKVKLAAGAQRAETEMELISDALATIRWYEPQIWVKLMRALTGMNRETSPGPKDSDGSAKVALIGIDRSLAAWGQLQFLIPELTDDFITLLLALDRLRNKTEAAFPHARAFRRKGFDEEVTTP